MTGPLVRIGHGIGRAALFAAFAALLGVFSHWPPYSAFGPDEALLTLSLVHAGQRKGPCRQRSAAEIAALAANMRRAEACPRERLPLQVTMTLDGVPLVVATAPPSGLSRDGMSTLYRRLPIGAGRHRLATCLRDSARPMGCDWAREAEIVTHPGERFVVDFRSEEGGFLYTGLPPLVSTGGQRP
jgi:hypothetical protein